MAKINPNDKQFDTRPEGGGGDRPEPVGPGRKLLAAVGFERYDSRNGNPMVSVRFVCLHDFDGNGDERGEIWDQFTLTDRAMWRIVEFARALRFPDAFDPEVDEDVTGLLTHGYVEADVRMDTWNGKERPKVDRFHVARSVDEDPDWPAWLEAGEERHRGYLSWRADNPRDGYGSSGSGSSGYSSRGSSSGSSRGSSRPANDIPF